MAAHVTENCPSFFPFKTKQTAVVLNNHQTELICTQYEEKLYIVVTQYNKVGTLVNITRDNIIDETGDTTPMFSIDVLMGRDEPMTHVIAKNLITKLPHQKPIVLSLALKDSSQKTVKTLAQILPTLL